MRGELSLLGQIRSLSAAALVALAGSGCTVVHGTGEWLGVTCEWVEWQKMDPTSPSAPRPDGAGPDDETCYLTWPDSGRLVLANRGDSHDSISCEERDESRYTAEDPLVVRPGQIAWIYGTYSNKPRVNLALTLLTMPPPCAAISW